MATADRILALKLVTDTASAAKGMKSVQKDMTKVQKAQGRMSAGFKRMGAAIAGLFAVDVGINILQQGVEDFFAAEKAAKDLDRVLSDLGQNTARNMKLIDRAATEALSLNVDDTEFVQSLTRLSEQTGFAIPKKLRIMRVAMDLMATRGGTLAENVNLVRKALAGKKKALEELGLPTDREIDDTRLLARLEKRYGGAAEENAQSLPGRWAQIQTQFGEFVEGMVGETFRLADDMQEGMKPLTQSGTNPFDLFLGLARGSLDKLSDKLDTTAVDMALSATQLGQDMKAGISNPLGSLIGIVAGQFASIEKAITGAQDGIRTASQGVADAIREPIVNTLGVIEQRATTTLDRMTDSLSEMQAKLRAIRNSGVFKGIVGTLLGAPGFAEGGIVTRPTLAMIGEKGPEAVVPLTGSGAGGFGGITVNVYAGVGNPVEIGREVDRVLRAYRGRAGLAA